VDEYARALVRYERAHERTRRSRATVYQDNVECSLETKRGNYILKKLADIAVTISIFIVGR
jgi:hypothetical protein